MIGNMPGQQAAFDAWNPTNYQQGLSSDLVNGILNQGWRTAPNANVAGSFIPPQFSILRGNTQSYDSGENSSYSVKNPDEIMYSGGTSSPDDYRYYFDTNGKYLRRDLPTKDPFDNPLFGVAAVAGAGLGMAALGGMAAGTTAAGAGTGGIVDSTAAGYGGIGGAEGMGGGATLGDAVAGAGAGTGAGVAGAGGAGVMPPNPYYASGNGFMSQLGGKMATTGLSSLFSGGGQGNSGGYDWGSLANALGPAVAGGMDAYRQNQAGNQMLDWLNGQQKAIQGMYGEGTPELQYLQHQLEAKDAAAGRNSQYGDRAVQIAGIIGRDKLDAMTRLDAAFARPYSEALNQRAGSIQGLTGALGAMGQKGTLGQLINQLTGYNPSVAGGGVPPNPYGGSFDPGAYDSGYVDPSTINYTGDFQYPDAGAGDWGPIDVSSWF